MTLSKEDLFRQAVNLSPMDRAQLVEAVLSSFNFKDRSDIDAAWAAESEARYEAVKKGQLKTVSMEEVFSSINN